MCAKHTQYHRTSDAAFYPGQTWNDSNGVPIQAHGGCILYSQGLFYWYGEHKGGATLPSSGCEYRVDVIGIACYSSTDLYNWHYEGVVLPSVKEDQYHDLHTSKVVERPKVIYNETSRTFVMWLHIDVEDYSKAKAGVAVSDTPTGPFQYVGSIYPNGVDSRDITLFKDDDGTAYLIHAGDRNKTLYISRLDESYLRPTGEYTRCFIDQSREAPALFKHRDRYYMISSGCTGWDPNTALIAEAEQVMGCWELKDNPCVGNGARKTFFAQSSFVFSVPHVQDAYVFMADRWVPHDLMNSTYVWLPIAFKDEGPLIKWHDNWDLNYFTRTFQVEPEAGM